MTGFFFTGAGAGAVGAAAVAGGGPRAAIRPALAGSDCGARGRDQRSTRAGDAVGGIDQRSEPVVWAASNDCCIQPGGVVLDGVSGGRVHVLRWGWRREWLSL